MYDFEYFQALHLGYLILKIYSPIKFYHSYVFQWYQENWKVSMAIAMYFNDIKKTEKFRWPCGH